MEHVSTTEREPTENPPEDSIFGTIDRLAKVEPDYAFPLLVKTMLQGLESGELSLDDVAQLRAPETSGTLSQAAARVYVDRAGHSYERRHRQPGIIARGRRALQRYVTS